MNLLDLLKGRRQADNYWNEVMEQWMKEHPEGPGPWNSVDTPPPSRGCSETERQEWLSTIKGYQVMLEESRRERDELRVTVEACAKELALAEERSRRNLELARRREQECEELRKQAKDMQKGLEKRIAEADALAARYGNALAYIANPDALCSAQDMMKTAQDALK